MPRISLPSIESLHAHPSSISRFAPALPSRVSFRIRAMDAMQPFDQEWQLRGKKLQENNLKIAILGFGNFGQFLSKRFVQQGHSILAYSRTDHSNAAKESGVEFFKDPHDLCESHPDVLLLATSILSTEKVIASFPFQRLRRSTLVVDVLSVKEFARSLLLKHLPKELDILCTHPMFGPESGKTSWAGLPLVYDKVRIGAGENRASRCDKFLAIFEREGCKMVEMTCAEHDRYAAGSQFITHTMGRVLEKCKLESSPINTKGYETLLQLVNNTSGDSFELYYGLFLYNKNALQQLQQLETAFEEIKNELFGKLHGFYRKQIFGNDEEGVVVKQKLLGNGSVFENGVTENGVTENGYQ